MRSTAKALVLTLVVSLLFGLGLTSISTLSNAHAENGETAAETDPSREPDIFMAALTEQAPLLTPIVAAPAPEAPVRQIDIPNGSCYFYCLAAQENLDPVDLWSMNPWIKDPNVIPAGGKLTVEGPRYPVPNTIPTWNPPAPPAPPAQEVQVAQPVTTPGLNWDRLADCEAGDKDIPGTANWSIIDPPGLHFGGLQFLTTTWLENGGGEFAPTANLATREQQIEIAERLYAVRGDKPWQCRKYLHEPMAQPAVAPAPPVTPVVQTAPAPPAPDPVATAAPEQHVNTSVSAQGWTHPGPSGSVVTSEYEMRWGTMHWGIDIAVPGGSCGKPIYAASAGTVIAAGPANGFGLWVVIDHGNGVVTVYGHMHKMHVTVGQLVGVNHHIADISNNGQSKGCHLHFEVKLGGINGQKIEPIAFLRERGVNI